MNSFVTQQERKVLYILENFSANAIDDFSYTNIKTEVLPPNKTSALQSIKTGIGRSFKASFRRLFVNNSLYYHEECIQKGKDLKLTQSVKIYDVVRIIAKAWDQIPRSVTINGWLKAKILETFQELELCELRLIYKTTVSCAMKQKNGTVFNSELLVATLSAEEDPFLVATFSDVTRDAEDVLDAGNYADSEIFDAELLEYIRVEYTDIQRQSSITDLKLEAIDAFFDAESVVNVFQNVGEADDVEGAVNCAIEVLMDNTNKKEGYSDISSDAGENSALVVDTQRTERTESLK